jgi:hypothetical protein
MECLASFIMKRFGLRTGHDIHISPLQGLSVKEGPPLYSFQRNKQLPPPKMEMVFELSLAAHNTAHLVRRQARCDLLTDWGWRIKAKNLFVRHCMLSFGLGGETETGAVASAFLSGNSHARARNNLAGQWESIFPPSSPKVVSGDLSEMERRWIPDRKCRG